MGSEARRHSRIGLLLRCLDTPLVQASGGGGWLLCAVRQSFFLSARRNRPEFAFG